MAETENLRVIAARIETLVGEFGALPDPRVRHKAEEIVRLLMRLYGAGLANIVESAVMTAGETADARDRLFKRLNEDPLVTSLLVLHGLHPQDGETRIIGALERVRPYLRSHGGNVTLLGIERDVVHLRLEGNCDGCPSSSLTMKLAIEKAIHDAVPEVERIEVEEMRHSAKPSSGSAPARNTASGEWITLSRLPEFNVNLATAELGGTKLILCRVGETLYAYHNSCPSCGVSFSEAALRDEVLACPHCQRKYDVRRAGRCLDDGNFHLEPLPLLTEDQTIRISVPAGGV